MLSEGEKIAGVLSKVKESGGFINDEDKFYSLFKKIERFLE